MRTKPGFRFLGQKHKQVIHSLDTQSIGFGKRAIKPRPYLRRRSHRQHVQVAAQPDTGMGPPLYPKIMQGVLTGSDPAVGSSRLAEQGTGDSPPVGRFTSPSFKRETEANSRLKTGGSHTSIRETSSLSRSTGATGTSEPQFRVSAANKVSAL